jgi:diguanylate cyclase (GGDEF)-like protein/PAS domain S-box-containing protein
LLLGHILEAASDAIISVDAEQRILSCNRAGEEMFGYAAEDLVGCPLSMLLPERLHAAHEHHVAGFASGGIELRHMSSRPVLFGRRRDGEEFPAEITISKLVVDGRLILTAIVRDVALHDGVTGLANRVLFRSLVARALARADGSGTTTAVAYFDVDRFHGVNERFGHDAGDELLRAIAERLTAVTRPADAVARIGNDEFAVLCEDLEHDHVALQLAEDYQEATFLTFRHDDIELPITTSGGVAVWKESGGDGDALTREAGIAADRAKAAGSARLEVFDPVLRVEMLERLELELELHHALEREELRVHFQPVVDLSDDRTVGFEALLRWEHPERGLLEAGQFIGVIENSWLIDPIGAWVIEEVCDQLARWNGPETSHVLVSANLSTRQLTDDLPGVVAEAIEASGVDPARIWLEITETALMDDPERSERVLGRLHDLGTTIVIDDFGTGYSSLGYLKRFPVGVVKIDGSFVDGLGVDRDDTAIVNAVIAVAHGLGLRAVAEGVETEQQVIALRALGCDLAQGYYFARARPEGEAFDPIGPTSDDGGAGA